LGAVAASEDRRKVAGQLASLLIDGLPGLSKTKAHAEADLDWKSRLTPQFDSRLQPIDGLYIVTLQTPTLLCNPADLNEISGSQELENSYRQTWNQLSDHSLQLVRYFARQTLAGGFYLYRRFQDSRQPYRPYLLTEAGSVFVFKVVDQGKAQDYINTPVGWVERSGTHHFSAGWEQQRWVPLRCTHPTRSGFSVRHYLPQNGYGEIAVNLATHWDDRADRLTRPECGFLTVTGI
jgi:hypothetical protein